MLFTTPDSLIIHFNFHTRCRKYRKLYEQYVRSEDGNLIPVLHQIEDELNALKSRVEEAVDVYKEVIKMGGGWQIEWP